MKTLLRKITLGVFTFSLLVLISSGCEDAFSNEDENGGNLDPDANTDNPRYADGVSLNDYYLLHATFEGDVIGDAPDKSLQFNPVGDELEYNSRLNFEVVGVGSKKALRLEPHSSPIKFVSHPTNFERSTISVRWAANMMTHGEGYEGPHGYKRFLIKTNSSGSMDTLVVIDFVGRVLSVRTQAVGLEWHNLDAYRLLLHTNSPQVDNSSDYAYYDFDCQFVVDLNYASKTFDLTIVLLDGGHIVGVGPASRIGTLQGPVIKVEDLPFYDETPSSSSTDPVRPTLYATNYFFGGTAPCIMDYVTIIKKP